MAADGAHWRSRRAVATADAGGELATILAGSPPGVLSMTGGFPNPRTFDREALAAVSAEVLAAGEGALQYSPVAGVPSTREYLADRQEALQGRRPDWDELIVTSGGMECLALVGDALIDPGDVVLVEAPTYLGALMAFQGAGAVIEPVACDEDGLVVEALEERLADAGASKPKLLYVIPEFQNPTGRTLSGPRRAAVVEACRRAGVLVFEDVAYRELAFDGGALPSLWSLAPDMVVQAGTFSKVFFPGVRLGWAAGPAGVIAALADAKQTTDQGSGALGQRMLETYGRAGHFDRSLPVARALYESHWLALQTALETHMPPGCSWTVPAGGFLTWVTLPEGVDAVAIRGAATAAGVAYVPGPPFHADGGGRDALRLSYSHLTPPDLHEAVRRLAGVVRAAT